MIDTGFDLIALPAICKGKAKRIRTVTSIAGILGSVMLGLTMLGSAHAQSVYRIETVAENLNHPWSLAFLPDGSNLIAERSGTIRHLTEDGLSDPISGLPDDVYVRSQAGLFDLVLSPDFQQSGEVYLAYASGTGGDNATAIWRARFDGISLVDGEVIFRAEPGKDTASHYGGRIGFLPDGTLLVTLGEGFEFREEAQVLSNHMGSSVRLNRDGSVPDDNPFLDNPDARPETFTYGHRNPQGLFIDPVTGEIWQHEHGPRGGDEVNILVPGANYGWPIATSGVDYNGARISPFSSHRGFEAPLLEWTPSIAPSGLTRYYGEAFLDWQGDLFVGALKDRDVRRLRYEDGVLTQEEILFEEIGARIRAVYTGPDGYLYLLTDQRRGRLLRVVPD